MPTTTVCTTPPNCWAIYCCGKVFKYLLSIGGLEEMEKRNIAKAKVIYDFLDSSKLFKGAVVPQDRSLMNIPFVTGDKELDAAVVAASKEAGFDNLKATSPWAVCGPPCTTPCPSRAHRPGGLF